MKCPAYAPVGTGSYTDGRGVFFLVRSGCSYDPPLPEVVGIVIHTLMILPGLED